MAIVKKAGTELLKGMFTVGNGLEEQSGTKSVSGELKTYRDKDGTVVSLYAIDANDREYQFEGIMKTSGYTAKKVGDTITLSGVTGTLLVKSWEEVYQNDEVTKVRGTVHKYADIGATSGTGSN